MKRYQNAALIASWAAFIWVIYRQAGNTPVSDVFWINLAYVVVTMSIIIASWIGSLFLYAHLFDWKPIIAFSAATAIALALAAFDVFWLQDWVAQWF